MTIKEKVAYIKGLAEGKEIKDATAQDLVINKILEVLTDLAESVENLDNGVSALADYVDEIDADLGDLEEVVYTDDDEYDDYDDEDYDYEDALITCPKCKTSLELEEDDDLDNLVCPNCGEQFTIEEAIEDIETDGEEDSKE
jgi:predicted RNA-binding Zn-ribbon protein involved in translation (DUF1610 family)